MKESERFETTDRYKAMGIPYPDPETMCKGPCEGTGFYPQFLAGPWLKPSALRLMSEDASEEEIRRWHEVHLVSEHDVSQEPPYERVCDGWHFIRCPDCEGSGKRNVPEREAETVAEP